jgi:regulator of cell morphogenesis and NO signaling
MDNQLLNSISIREIVNKNPGSISVFEKFKIDYCCNGKFTFEEACQRAKVSKESVAKLLEETVSDNPLALIRAHLWPLDFLASFIVHNHHAYVKSVTPEILFLTGKVSKAHSARHPEVEAIKTQFEILSDELEKHMYKEEAILFPAVTGLVKRSNNLNFEFEQIADAEFQLMYPIEVMEAEHVSAGKCLAKIRELSDDYTLPEDACNSFELLYQRLREFEDDLHTHIHLENNILFPKALELEASLLKNSFTY